MPKIPHLPADARPSNPTAPTSPSFQSELLFDYKTDHTEMQIETFDRCPNCGFKHTTTFGNLFQCIECGEATTERWWEAYRLRIQK